MLGSSSVTHKRKSILYGTSAAIGIRNAKAALKAGKCGTAKTSLIDAAFTAGAALANSAGDRSFRGKRALFGRHPLTRQVVAVGREFAEICVRPASEVKAARVIRKVKRKVRRAIRKAKRKSRK